MGAQDREEYTQDVEMKDDAAGLGGSKTGAGILENATKAKLQDTGRRHQQNLHNPLQPRAAGPELSQHLTTSEDSTTASTHSPQQTISAQPSTGITSATFATSQSSSPSTRAIPTIDEQVDMVIKLIEQPARDKQKGYVVSTRWLYGVVARSTRTPEGITFDKSATEGDIGPVDSSELIMTIDESGFLKDEEGQPFIAMRPGLMLGQDFRVLPQEAWTLVTKWYGQSGPVITRFAHRTSAADDANCEYEIYPPIFSLLKVPSAHTAQTQKEQSQRPVRMLASRETLFQDWLRRAKELVHISSSTKVRPWKIRGGLKSTNASGMLTPAASRSASPAPGADIVASAGDTMVLDVNTFAALQIGEQREVVDLKDETANENYNGKSLTLNVAGLSRDEVVALEESATNGDWASNNVKTNFVSGKGSLGKPKFPGSGGRQSPGPGVMTRGRQRRDDRPRGMTGLSNLGNTCYMNSALQCLRSVQELTLYFLQDCWKRDLNTSNPLGHHGQVARAYADLLKSIYEEGQTSFSPTKFKTIIGRYGPNFAGYSQQDSQEFLLFLLDGLQEDLNRVHKKPYIEKPDSTDEMVRDYEVLKAFAARNWADYKARNDSVITDLFAGLYKSTVTCPVCDKVSIIFDPFSNLTLQLPVENIWTKDIWFFPLYRRPIRIDVEVDKFATVKDVKKFIADRMHVEVEKLVMSEVYKNRFYKIFNNHTIMSEAGIQKVDNIAVCELDSIPTNYNPDKRKRHSTSIFTSTRDSEDPVVDAESPEAERLLVPVFHRRRKEHSAQKPFFGEPTYIVVSREDSKSYDRILQKALGVAMTMTTTRIIDDEEISSNASVTPEGSDTVLINRDETNLETASGGRYPLRGEEAFVDVSMADAWTAIPAFLRPGAAIPNRLRYLFSIKSVSTHDNVPTGWNEINESNDYNLIPDPIATSTIHRPKRSRGSLNVVNGTSEPASSDEDDAEDIPHGPVSVNSGNSTSDSYDQVGNSTDDEASMRSAPSSVDQRKLTFQSVQLPLIHPGDAIILDWTSDSFDSLFTGAEDDSAELRGRPTWLKMDLWPDKELKAMKEKRQARRKHGVTLDDCLNEFGKSETLSENNAWYCPRCKEHRRADKKFEIWKVPDILVMHLKRFSSNRNWRDKLEIPVEYPVEGLDMTGRVIEREPGKSLIYDLIAVDNHYGGLGGGHYTAFAKNFYNGTWYEYNGESTVLA